MATPDKNTVRVCLADVYMHTGDYIEAKKLSGEVVNSGTYQLVQVAEPRDFDKVFGADLTTSTEEIFYIKTSRIMVRHGTTYPIPHIQSMSSFPVKPC